MREVFAETFAVADPEQNIGASLRVYRAAAALSIFTAAVPKRNSDGPALIGKFPDGDEVLLPLEWLAVSSTWQFTERDHGPKT